MFNHQEMLKEYDLIANMLSKSIHDINNPFAVIIGQMSILEILLEKDQLEPEKLKKVIDKVKVGTEKMKQRMEELRSFYKITQNDPLFDKWQAIIKNVLCLHQSRFDLVESQIGPDKKTNIDPQLAFFTLHHLMHCIKAESEQTSVKIFFKGDNLVVELMQGSFNSQASEQETLTYLLEKCNAVLSFESKSTATIAF